MRRRDRQRINSQNRKRPSYLTTVPENEWPPSEEENRTSVWVSCDYLVQEFQEKNCVRLSINRTKILGNGRWDDKLSWDELQAIKYAVGYSDSYAVEVFPKDKDVVNVANMRHLWVLPEPLDIGWIK